MPLRNAKDLTIQPKGLSDAVDGTNTFPGAMGNLTNLIPDPSTPTQWVSRPAAQQLTTFPGFASPGFVSASLVVGDLEYGMIASALNAGKDQPYVYNIATNTFLTVAGINSGNVPTSPPSTGAWTPPIMAVVGNRVVVCHPGFPGGAVKFGWFDISGLTDTSHTGNTHSSVVLDTLSANVLQAGWQPGMTISGAGIPANTTIVSIASNGLSLTLSQAASSTSTGVALTVAGGTPTAPLWGAGDTNINNLPSVPVAVAQFNGRAYFACGVNGVPYSDSGFSGNRTNATQALTFANGVAVTALGALPLSSPITGGIIQSIIAFQGVTAMQEITGDPATSNLSTNVMNVATGTFAPLSICSTNFGLVFCSPEGLRVIDFNGRISDPIGSNGSGVTIPLMFAVQPSRICAAANADVIRVTTQNGSNVGQVNQEYWYDITLKTWSGPHTFPASLIQPWRSTFFLHPAGLAAGGWQSDAQQSLTSTFTENGTPLQWTSQTVLLPDNHSMCENAIIQSTLAVAGPGGTVTVSVQTEQGVVLDTETITLSGNAALWLGFNWGGGTLWGGNSGGLQQYRIPWSQPLVFKQMAFSARGLSGYNVRVGNIYLMYQELGYLIQQ